HWVALVPPVLWTLAALIALWLGYSAADAIFDDGSTPAKSVVGLAVTVGWIVLALVPTLRWRFTMFVLTTDRLIVREGIIAKSSKEIPLERINDVAFKQSILERVLGAGDLIVESAGERGQNLIRNVRKPEEVQLLIYKEAEKNNARMVAPQASSGTSIPEQIEALARLRDRGALSDAEFEAKKKELLDRL
ncbi:MAG: PH domain-containing protein, partial [Actinomycetota bacterium]